jgi:hypothetical protein
MAAITKVLNIRGMCIYKFLKKSEWKKDNINYRCDTYAGRAGLCPWDKQGKANSCPLPTVHKNLPHTWTTMRQQRYEGKAEM